MLYCIYCIIFVIVVMFNSTKSTVALN